MEITVIVIPNAKASSVVKIGENNYKVKVNAPAEGGRANEQLIEILAEFFDVRKSLITVLKGSKSRHKTIQILF